MRTRAGNLSAVSDLADELCRHLASSALHGFTDLKEGARYGLPFKQSAPARIHAQRISIGQAIAMFDVVSDRACATLDQLRQIWPMARAMGSPA